MRHGETWGQVSGHCTEPHNRQKTNRKEMKNIFILLLLTLMTTLTFGQTKINYKIFYSDNLQNEGLKIQVLFSSKKASDSTYFRYSNEVWGETNLTNCLILIEKENPKYTFKILADSNRIVVYHPHEKNISFSYHIIQDIKEEYKFRVIQVPRAFVWEPDSLANEFLNQLELKKSELEEKVIQ